MKKMMVAGLVILVLLMAGCDHFPDPKLTILSHQWTIEHIRSLGKWRVVISGLAVNNGNRRLTYAEVNSRVYSSERFILKDNFTNILGLNKGERWYFSMVNYVSMAPASYDVWAGDIYFD